MSTPNTIPQAFAIESIIDALAYPALLVNVQQQVIMANAAAATFSDRSRDSLIGCSAATAFGCVVRHPETGACGHHDTCSVCRMRDEIERLFLDRSPRQPFTTQIPTKNNIEKLMRISVGYLRDVDAALLSYEEITPGGIEEAIADNRNLCSLVEIAGKLFHKITQPLQVAAGYLDIILIDGSEQIPQRELIVTAREQLMLAGEISRQFSLIRRSQKQEKPAAPPPHTLPSDTSAITTV